LRRAVLFVLFGPSGVGKDSVLRAVLPRVEGLTRCVSVTTRPPRPGEVEGKDHWYVSEDAFRRMVHAGEFLEWAQYVGHHYGTPRASVEKMIQQGADVVVRVEVQGAEQIRASVADAVLIFLVAPSWEELRRRLDGRRTENSEEIEKRLAMAREEVRRAHCGPKGVPLYDYLVVNDDVERAAAQVTSIITAERLRAGRASLPLLEQ